MAKRVEDMTDSELDDFITSGGGSKSPQDMSDDELNTFITKKSKPEPSFEEQYMEPYVYPALEGVGKGVALAAKPASMIATPILESTRAALKYVQGKPVDGIDTMSDFKSMANQKASSAGLMSDIYDAAGIKQQTIGEMTGGLPDVIKRNFPKASSVLESLRPSDVAAIPADIMMYGKIAGPTGEQLASSAINSTLNQKTLAKNIVKAGSTDSTLLNNLNSSGKLEDIAQRVIDDPSLNKVDRLKVLQELSGKAAPYENEYGIIRHGVKGGKIGTLAKEQSDFIESLPNDKYSFDIMDANIRAKELLKKDSLLGSTENAASKKIDEFLPFNQTDQSQLDTIRNRSEYSSRLDDINKAIEQSKIDEISKLSNAQRDAISGMNSSTSEIYPNVEMESHAQEIERIQNEIESLIKGKGEDHPAIRGLIKQRNDIAEKFWDLAGSGFPSEDAYAEHLNNLNQRPIQEANEARILANKYKSSLVKGTEEYNATESAANATEKAAREALDVSISQLPEDQQYAYHKKQSELSDLLSLRDLYSGTYSRKGGLNVPVGDMVRGAAREAINLKGTYIDPHLLNGAKKMGIGGGDFYNVTQRLNDTLGAAKPLSYSTPFITHAIMNRSLVENLADFEIPRDSKSILEKKDMVLAKVAQITNDPNILAGLKDALEKHPDKLETIIATMSTQFPNLFVADKYNRVNGKIFHPDPMVKQQMINRAYKDVNNKAKTNTEKIMLHDGLNRDGSLPESFQ